MATMIKPFPVRGASSAPPPRPLTPDGEDPADARPVVASLAGRWADLPIQRKLFLAFVVMDVLVLAAVGLFFPIREFSELRSGREGLAAEGRAVAELVASAVAPALDFSDTATAGAVLKRTTERLPQVTQITIHTGQRAGQRAGSSDDAAPRTVFGGAKTQTAIDGSSIWVRHPLSTGSDVSIVLQLSQAALRARFLWSLSFAAALSIAFLLLGGLLAQVLSRGIVRPINAVMDTVGAVGREGSWDLTQRVRERGRDEAGRLAIWVNRFLADSAQLVGNVKRVSGEVIGGSTEMKTSLDGLAEAANALNDTIAQVANTAEESVAHMRQNLAVATDSSQLADRVRANAENAGQAAAHVVESSRNGQKVAERARTQIVQISERTAETRQIMDSLTVHSGRIDSMLQALRAIAAQTNLLALNAAIEAARAGDQGRGFAVVADEVRKLADQAAQYAAEIGGSMDGIRRDIDAAVTAVAKVDSEVEGGAAVIAANADLLLSIVVEVESVASDVRSIAELTVQQQTALSRVTESAAAITQLGSEQAASAAEMAATVEEQTASTNEVSAAAEQLHTVVRELQAQVEKIKV